MAATQRPLSVSAGVHVIGQLSMRSLEVPKNSGRSDLEHLLSKRYRKGALKRKVETTNKPQEAGDGKDSEAWQIVNK